MPVSEPISRQTPAPGAPADAARPPRPLAAWAAGLDRARLARAALVICAVLGLLSILPELEIRRTSPFDLDGEIYDLGIGAAWSTFLLVAAALAALLAAEAAGSRTLAVFAAFLGFMSLDEAAGIHEELEKLTGVDWQVIYAPIVAFGGMAALAVIARMRRNGCRAGINLLLGGATAWFVAQVLEKIQWDGDRQVHGYYGLATAEELLEMAGSLMFGLAMLALLRAIMGAASRPR